jgi:hypothetical protein
MVDEMTKYSKEDRVKPLPRDFNVNLPKSAPKTKLAKRLRLTFLSSWFLGGWLSLNFENRDEAYEKKHLSAPQTLD